jgi:hypothetical protein
VLEQAELVEPGELLGRGRRELRELRRRDPWHGVTLARGRTQPV